MKVKELLNQLKQYDKNLDVIIFAAGSLYAPNGLQLWNEEGKEVLEIGCGWDQIDDE